MLQAANYTAYAGRDQAFIMLRGCCSNQSIDNDNDPPAPCGDPGCEDGLWSLAVWQSLVAVLQSGSPLSLLSGHLSLQSAIWLLESAVYNDNDNGNEGDNDNVDDDNNDNGTRQRPAHDNDT